MDIEQIARECGFDYDAKDVFVTCPSCYTDIAVLPALHKFAASIRSEVMEECVRRCEIIAENHSDEEQFAAGALHCSELLRAAAEREER